MMIYEFKPFEIRKAKENNLIAIRIDFQTYSHCTGAHGIDIFIALSLWKWRIEIFIKPLGTVKFRK